MREIKFRAWDDKEIIYSDNIAYDKMLRNERLASFFDDCYDCEIMQYTGLKDKNGKEIYESDIVKKLHCESGVIEFQNGGFSNKVKTPKGIRWYDLNGENAGLSEIIGNIYENPELLGE